MEELEHTEQNRGGDSTSASPTITLKQAIDFGEYRPEYLANFSEWHCQAPLL